MSKAIFFISNTGRSGSSFLYRVLKQNYGDKILLSHKALPAAITQPKIYGRRYQAEDQSQILKESNISQLIDYWEKESKSRIVIECGWTMSHLAPVMAERFGDQFRFATLVRHPLSVAASRAAMGNYNGRYGRDIAHELSPHDERALCVEWRDSWSKLSPLRKCFYWWAEWAAREKEMQSNLEPNYVGEIRAEKMFGETGVLDALSILSLDPPRKLNVSVDKNPLEPWLLEAYPLGDSWREILTDSLCIQSARLFGYEMPSQEDAKRIADKYQCPEGIMSGLRHRLRWWQLRNNVKRFVSAKL